MLDLHLRLSLIREKLDGERVDEPQMADDTDAAQWVSRNDLKERLDPTSNPVGLRQLVRNIVAKLKGFGVTGVDGRDVLLAVVDTLIEKRLPSFFGKGMPLGDRPITCKMVKCAAEELNRDVADGNAKADYDNLRKGYESSKRSLTSPEFLEFIQEKVKAAEVLAQQAQVELDEAESEEESVPWWKRLIDFILGRTAARKVKLKKLKAIVEASKATLEPYLTAQEDVDQIRNIIETGEAYRSLCAQIDNLQAEKAQCEAEVANLRLTSFRDTLSIVDLGKARAHFAKRMDDQCKGYKKLVAQKYEASVGGGQSGARALDSVYNALRDELHKKYDSVDWNEPFDFIIPPDSI